MMFIQKQIKLFLQSKEGASQMTITRDNSTIEFRNVNFSYVPGKPIFNNLSLTIPAGKKIAVVGGSGSGYVFDGFLRYLI